MIVYWIDSKNSCQRFENAGRSKKKIVTNTMMAKMMINIISTHPIPPSSGNFAMDPPVFHLFTIIYYLKNTL